MTVVVISHESSALAGNPLGDPSLRKLHLIVPDNLPSEPIPCIWYLAGYAGVGRGMLADDPWQEGLEERVARLTQEGKLGPCIIALPDCFTRFGGCQYLGSSAVGDYETYLLAELRQVVEQKYRISAHGVVGKSSGGHGALVHAMRHPRLFDGVVCHSGDMGFELSVFPEIPLLMNAVRDHGGLENFVRAFEKTQKKKDGRWFGPMSMLALASVYSPSPGQPWGIALPFDLSRGTLDSGQLGRWLAWDPVRMIERGEYQQALRRMKLVWLDCGSRDEHFLHWGALQLHARLDDLGIPHLYESFEDGHRNTSYRLDLSLPRLYSALSGNVTA